MYFSEMNNQVQYYYYTTKIISKKFFHFDTLKIMITLLCICNLF